MLLMKNFSWICPRKPKKGNMLSFSLSSLLVIRVIMFATAGEKGAYAHQVGTSSVVFSSGFKVDAVETIGAGDSFIAGAICSLVTSATNDLGKHVEFACLCGAQKCSQIGFSNIGALSFKAFQEKSKL
jgi:fructose-1-phosphate kinase PfkB-like protein